MLNIKYITLTVITALVGCTSNAPTELTFKDLTRENPYEAYGPIPIEPCRQTYSVTPVTIEGVELFKVTAGDHVFYAERAVITADSELCALDVSGDAGLWYPAD